MDFASITLAGHVVAVPTLRKGKNDKEYGTFSIAVNQWYGGQEVASFYNCVIPGTMYANMCKASVGRGSSISITGMLTLRSYRGENGQERTSADIRVLDWRFIGSAKKSETSARAPRPANAPAYWQGGQNSGMQNSGQNPGMYDPRPTPGFVEEEDTGDLPV